MVEGGGAQEDFRKYRIEQGDVEEWCGGVISSSQVNRSAAKGRIGMDETATRPN